ncbi:hypothetical protein BD626DRAFT_475514 [Schizophyllum amplum]|uniref:Uncharacterized protein n=1 Tax=Schizophyllum amplum TaxID=97359 RepID=A0A550CYH8_9AGAR|nr:hypothetical protein BD626DRAFT_475514 [Auriculariopsis ampla]
MYNAPRFFGQNKANDNVILVYLSPSSPPPVSVPFELQEYVSKDAWASRITTITRTASGFSRPLFEKIWAAFSFLLLMIVPMAISSVLNATLRDPENLDWRFRAREISLGIFFGLMFLVTMPMVIWKAIGQRHLNRTILRWTQQDNQSQIPSGGRATWSARLPRMFSDQIVVSITVPQGAFPSLFHPDAYLPSYVRGPIDAQAAFYNPYAEKAGQGMAPMSTLGSVPLYDERSPPSYGDEKHQFVDFKRSSKDSLNSIRSSDTRVQRKNSRS